MGGVYHHPPEGPPWPSRLPCSPFSSGRSSGPPLPATRPAALRHEGPPPHRDLFRPKLIDPARSHPKLRQRVEIWIPFFPSTKLQSFVNLKCNPCVRISPFCWVVSFLHILSHNPGTLRVAGPRACARPPNPVGVTLTWIPLSQIASALPPPRVYRWICALWTTVCSRLCSVLFPPHTVGFHRIPPFEWLSMVASSVRSHLSHGVDGFKICITTLLLTLHLILFGVGNGGCYIIFGGGMKHY